MALVFVGFAWFISFLGALAAIQVDRFLHRSARPAVSEAASPSEAPRLWPTVTPAAAELPAPADFSAAAAKLMPSVVAVDSLQVGQTFMGEPVLMPIGSGSGVVLSRDGLIITNHHVIERSEAVRVRTPDGRAYDAEVVGSDARSDIAVLRIRAQGLVPAEIGRSADLKVGEWVMAVGNPFGYENTVSVGVVSSLGRTLPTRAVRTLGGVEQYLLIDAIQTDAAINQGNSGGALADARGRLVGINTAIISPTGGSVGIGFAIPVDRARRIVDELLRFGRVRYGSLGISMDLTSGLLEMPEVRRVLRRETGAEPPSRGILITGVEGGGPAARAGIVPGDVVQSFDGRPIREPIDFLSLLRDRRAGDTVELRVWSRGRTKTLRVVLGELR